jgi:hypothetical protein
MCFENRGVILHLISALIDQQAASFKNSGSRPTLDPVRPD